MHSVWPQRAAARSGVLCSCGDGQGRLSTRLQKRERDGTRHVQSLLVGAVREEELSNLDVAKTARDVERRDALLRIREGRVSKDSGARSSPLHNHTHRVRRADLNAELSAQDLHAADAVDEHGEVDRPPAFLRLRKSGLRPDKLAVSAANACRNAPCPQNSRYECRGPSWRTPQRDCRRRLVQRR